MLLLLARDEGSSTDLFIKVGLFLLFIGLPAIKSLMDTIKKSRAGGSGGALADADKRAAESQAKQRWEEILRGEAEPEVPAEAPPPVPIQNRAASNTRPAAMPLSERASEPPTLSGMSRAPTEDEEETFGADNAPDEETIAVEANERRLREERARRKELMRLERESSPTRRSSVESQMVSSLEADTSSASAELVNRPAPSGTTRTASSSVATRAAFLRSSVVGREVLDIPLALRPFEDWAGSNRSR